MPKPKITIFQFDFIKSHPELSNEALKKRCSVAWGTVDTVRKSATYADYLQYQAKKAAERAAIAKRLTGKKRVRFASIDTRAMPDGIDPKPQVFKDLEAIENVEVPEEEVVSLAEVLKQMKHISATMTKLLEAWNK